MVSIATQHLLRCVAFSAFLLLPWTSRAQCVGDCDGGGRVTVDELITGVSIALGTVDIAACRVMDANTDGQVTVNEIVTAVVRASRGCEAVDPACRRADCVAAFEACDAETRAVENASIAACPIGPSEESARCFEQVAKVHLAGNQVCADFLSACITCCDENGSQCAFAPEVPRAIGTFDLPRREILEQTPDLPPGPDGAGFMLLVLPDGDLGFDPFARNPVTAAAECAGAVIACFSPGERNWAGCLAAAPQCQTERPWEEDGPPCCAGACLDRYQALRRSGRANPAAFTAAIYEAPSCMPGLDAFTARETTGGTP